MYQRVNLYSGVEVSFPADETAPVIPDGCELNISATGKVLRLPLFKKREGEYALRFYAEHPGDYTYTITCGAQTLRGGFTCVEGEANGRGVVRTSGDGFVYQDGTRFFPFGTTCYNWINQPAELQETTLSTLRASCFNKVRMLIFPKFMPYNTDDPVYFPFEKAADGGWDVSRIVPVFWDNLDRRIDELMAAGVEADLILFHPYDKWGFASLTKADCMSYLAYCVARLSYHPNVWWSLANEYEMLFDRTESDWDDFGSYIAANDPYRHLISIHQILKLYPPRKWMTHCSIQSGNINLIPNWKREYGIPVIIDECGYEGDIEYNWGNLSAFEMVNRVWWSVTRGGYCTHGETFHRDDDVLWWGKGGVLRGQSEPRIRFLRELLEELPGVGRADVPNFTNPNDSKESDERKPDRRFLELMRTAKTEMMAGMYDAPPKQLDGDGWLLRYLGEACPCMMHITLDEGHQWTVEVIDVWDMTRTTVMQNASGKLEIKLPAKPGIAVLATRADLRH